MTKEEILQKIDNIDNDDENIELLKEAMEYYCSNYDICEGYKHALRICINDQYDNHQLEQDPEDLVILSTILNRE